MRNAVTFAFLSLLVFGLMVGGFFGYAAGHPALSVKMTGDESADIFVCARLEPGELTCLDLPTYVERVREHQAAQKRSDM